MSFERARLRPATSVTKTSGVRSRGRARLGRFGLASAGFCEGGRSTIGAVWYGSPAGTVPSGRTRSRSWWSRSQNRSANLSFQDDPWRTPAASPLRLLRRSVLPSGVLVVACDPYCCALTHMRGRDGAKHSSSGSADLQRPARVGERFDVAHRVVASQVARDGALAESALSATQALRYARACSSGSARSAWSSSRSSRKLRALGEVHRRSRRTSSQHRGASSISRCSLRASSPLMINEHAQPSSNSLRSSASVTQRPALTAHRRAFTAASRG